MDGFTPEASFGPDVATKYDDELRGDEIAAAEFLDRYSRGRPALEFAVGTGRIAIPLAERGVQVDGIELSEAMIDQLRQKPAGRDMHVVLGDMCEATARGPYGLVYLVYNTIGNVLTQDGQVQIFRNAARHLADDGIFIVETAVPWAWVNPLEPRYARPEYVAAGKVVLDVVDYDPVTQLANENHVTFDESGVKFGPIAQRVVSPAEMDLMAQLAGMRLRERFGGWRNEPFTAASTMHVSVFEKAAL